MKYIISEPLVLPNENNDCFETVFGYPIGQTDRWPRLQTHAIECNSGHPVFQFFFFFKVFLKEKQAMIQTKNIWTKRQRYTSLWT